MAAAAAARRCAADLGVARAAFEANADKVRSLLAAEREVKPLFEVVNQLVGEVGRALTFWGWRGRILGHGETAARLRATKALRIIK